MALLAAVVLIWPGPEPAFAEGVIAIDAGGAHTCAVTTSGGVKCWGSNSEGQLGDGTIDIVRAVPVGVVGLDSGIADVTAGRFHTCALTTTGGVKCWGRNSAGQLGDGTTTNSATPVDVSGLGTNVVAISAGGFYTCALTTAGGIKCWGSNSSGQLGDGQSCGLSCPIPLDAMGGLTSDVTAIATGGAHTCAVTTDGNVLCSGLNAFGQLGAASTGTCDVPSFAILACSTTPVDVSGLPPGVNKVVAGSLHTCAVTTEGRVLCWGRNGAGQLGDGTTADRTSPVTASGLTTGVATVALGGEHTCALTTAAGVKCWGRNNSGQIGDGTSNNVGSTPVDVAGLASGVTDVTAGGRNEFAEFLGGHTCALTTASGVKCWGDNHLGQLGADTSETCVDFFEPSVSLPCSTTPLDVSGLEIEQVPTPTPTVPAPVPTAGGLPHTGSGSDAGVGSIARWLITPLVGIGVAAAVIAAALVTCPRKRYH